MESELKYTTESLNIKEDSKVIDQFPSPGTEVSKASIIDLYLDEEFKSQDKIVLPDLTGKTKEDVIKILDGLNLKYQFIGEGKVIKQNPDPNTQVDINSTIQVEFSIQRVKLLRATIKVALLIHYIKKESRCWFET